MEAAVLPPGVTVDEFGTYQLRKDGVIYLAGSLEALMVDVVNCKGWHIPVTLLTQQAREHGRIEHTKM